MNQLVAFGIGLVIGLGIGFAVWKQPDKAPAEYSRAEHVPPEPPAAPEAKAEPPPAEAAPTPEPPSEPAEKTAPVERKPMPRTAIAVKKKAAPALTPEQLVEAHVNDSIDADWSEQATKKLRRDFESLESTHPVTVTRIDCRKTSCLLVLDWDYKSQAEAAQAEVLGARYSLQCSKRLVFPPGTGRSAHGYQTTLVFFDCAR